MNAIVGNVAYLICKVLTLAAQNRGCDRLIYNMLKGVEVFFIVPFAYLYVKLIKGGRISGRITGYDGNELVANIFHIIFIIWLIGAVVVSIYYVRRFMWTRKLCSNNVPYDNEQVKSLFHQFYPQSRLDKVEVYQNFLVNSPCIIGVRRPKLLMPERTYSSEELTVILAHEATHVIHRDNLWKCIGLAIVIACWWNPLIYPYLNDWDAWAETHCDVTVCKRFLNGDNKHYAIILVGASLMQGGATPPDLSPFKSDQSITGRVIRLSKMKKGKGPIALSVVLSAIFIAGSTLTAFAAGNATSEVGVTAFYNTLEQDTETDVVVFDLDNIDNVNVCVMSAEEVAEIGDSLVVMEPEDGTDTYATVKDFNWDIAAGEMGASPNFLKLKDKVIEASAYITSSGTVRFGVLRPDGSFAYANAPANRNTAISYTTESYGYHKVAVYNVTSSTINADGYYVR